MAIGDKPNQNLFGTNYNAEEEERKKAELAAQGAMMGAGNIPASAFGQAPAVAPFSMEAAGQVNPMMQPQNLESFAQPQVTFRDYDVPATPPASALSVFTPGGEVKPNVDVNAITPSPETTSTSAVNTALNQEVPVGSPENNDPSFMSRLGSFLNPSGAISSGAGLPPTFTPPSAGATQAQEGTDITPVTLESLGLESAGQKALKESLGQPPSNIDPFTGKTIEKPTLFDSGVSSSNGMTMNQKAIMDALGDQNQGMDVNQQAIANAQSQGVAQDQNETPAALGGMTLNEYLNVPAGTPGVSGLRTDPQGRMIPAGFETRAEAFPDFERESAAREARLDARPDFGEAVSDRDRRAARGDGISMADQVDMAKANARGATPREVARGNQVANALGVDLKTGQPLQATGGLTFDQIMKLEEFDFKRGQEAYKREQDDLIAQGKKTEAFEQDSALLRQVSGDAGRIGRLTNEAIGITTEPGTTALSGSLLKHVAGSDANQLKSILAVISSKVALDRLMEVKKTGATLGQVSEKELAMLQNSFDALDQSLPPERLREALTNYANQLKKVEDQTQRAFIDKHGQEKFNKIMGGGSTGQGEPRYVNDQDVGDSVDTYYNPSK
jgi:hypothetical protein